MCVWMCVGGDEGLPAISFNTTRGARKTGSRATRLLSFPSALPAHISFSVEHLEPGQLPVGGRAVELGPHDQVGDLAKVLRLDRELALA
jgi:hypothetical protein